MERYRTLDEFVRERLEDPEFAQSYMIVALEEYEKDKNIYYFLKSLKNIAEARGGMTELARKTKLSRQNLYKIFTSKSTPRLDTLDAILNALGFRLSVLPLKPVKAKKLAS